jgi:glycosyltransferase involved in cell wall biosynthesis
MPRPVNVLELRSVCNTGGGPEKTILLGAARADASRCRVTVCYLRDRRDDGFQIDQRASALPIDYVEVSEKHSFDPSIIGPLRALIRERRIDIVHAHDYKTDALALALARLEDVVPLSTAHGWTGHSSRERLVYYPLDRWLLKRFPRVIAVSSEIRDVLVRSGASADRIIVVLNAIDAERFRRNRSNRQAARARLGVDDSAFLIGAVGRAEPQKRFDLLQIAFAEIVQRYPHARLVIAGDGSMLPSLEQQRRELGLTGSCQLAGHVGDVAGLHDALDLFVLSSDYEGTPNAVLEAMAFETPVVATNSGGTAEVARDGREGVIVPCGDVGALVRAMSDVIEDPGSAAERVARARARVEGELSFATRVAKVEQLYQELRCA